MDSPMRLRKLTCLLREVPPELAKPALGMNFARDGMDEKDCLSPVAVHSGTWLLAVAFHFGACFGFDKGARKDRKTTLTEVYNEVILGMEDQF